MAKKNSDDINKDSLKAVEDFIKKTEQAKKNVNSINDAFGNIATQLFGISGAAFFKEVDKTTEELANQEQQASKLAQAVSDAYKTMGDTISAKFGDLEKDLKGLSHTMSSDLASSFQKVADSIGFDRQIKSMQDVVDLQDELNKLKSEDFDKFKEHEKDFEKFSKDKTAFEKQQRDFFKDNEDFYKKVLAQNTDFMSGLEEQERIDALIKIQQKGINGLVKEQSGLLNTIMRQSEGFTDEQKQQGLYAENLSDQFKKVSQELGNSKKMAFSLTDAFQKGAKNLASGIIPRMLEYDQAISDAGKNFGFVNQKSAAASIQMAALTSEAARFNMSVGDVVGLMGSLGDELGTINNQYLAGAVENFVAIEKATGISSQEISTIAGEMMRAGQSAEEVESFMEGANKTAKLFGVNTKKVLQGVSRNIDKMRQMGFVGGEESLTRMVATAERLRMNVDEIFDVAKRARTIEGAMDMAAELQLAGGSFAQINPMDLLSAARKGPEELQKILTQMGGDIGSWNEETGEFQFDPVDVDRLQIVADATGQSLDSIQKMIQKNAEDAKKADFMPDLAIGEVMGPDGKPLDQDMMNNMLADSMNIDGTIKEGSLLDEAGISDIKDLTSEQAQSILQDHINKQASLEEQAEQNQSFQDSITAFKDAVMNLFVVFEPVIKILTSFIQTINEMGPIAKGLTAAIIGFVMIAPKLGAALNAFKSIKDGIGGLLGKGKSMLPGGGQDKVAGQINQTADAGGETAKAKGSGGGLKSLAEGLKAMGDKNVFKGIAATALAGPALLLLLPGMPTVLLMGAVGAMGKLVEFGFQSLARGIAALGNAKGVMKGALMMVLIGASLIPFAFALTLFTDVDWGAVGQAALMLLATVGTLILLGALLSTPLGAFLLIGALGLVAVGLALMAFGASLLVFASAAQAMQGMEFAWLGDLGWNLLVAAPGLLLGGLALLAAAPGIMFGALALMPIVDLAVKASAVDWSVFAKMGDALLAVVPGLLAFSAGALVGGLMSGLGSLLGGGGPLDTLQQLAGIAMVAADPLMVMADAIDGLADGIEKLSTAAENLDVSKLEMLRSLAWSMAIGSFGGGMADSINQIAEALAKIANIGKGGGTGGGGGNKKIEINLKINGRDMQSIIVDDTEIVS